jgi:DNA invertase Pin-like site-specific DNA recombinase
MNNGNGRMTAVYVRVSTGKQDISSQLPELLRWCKAHVEGADGLDATALEQWAERSAKKAPTFQGQDGLTFYRDAFTGKTMERSGADRMLSEVRAGQVSRIVVWRLDRLGRTNRGLAALFDELRDRKVDLVSLREGFDLNTPAGRLLAHIVASVAEYETEVRAERIRAGQAAAKAKGKRWGGRKPGTFTKLSPERIEAIRKMHADRVPISRIARTLGLSRPTVYRALALDGNQ